MGIRINVSARNDVSYLFSSLGSSAANVAGSDFLGQYASIKNGSYAKLMKAYYGQNNNSAVKSLAKDTVKRGNALTAEETKAVAKIQSSTDALKESADVLLNKGSKSVFNLTDITEKDAGGVETTRKDYDVEAIYNAVNQFAKDYNAVLDAVDGVDIKSVQNRTDSLLGATVQNLKLLNKIGVTIDKNGRMSVDKETFSKSNMSTVKSLFQGSGSYGYQVSAQASMMNFAADREASKANTYTVKGRYGNTYNTGNLYNSYF